MRLNPFSQGVGRRRAAMIRGEASDDGAPVIETEDKRDEAPPAEDAAISRDGDVKQFGFAYREEQARKDSAARMEADTALPYDAPDDRLQTSESRAASDDQGVGENVRIVEADARKSSAAGPSAVEGQVVTTPHIEHLRAQIGADAANAIEPWLPDPPETRVSPIVADPGTSIDQPSRPAYEVDDVTSSFPPLDPSSGAASTLSSGDGLPTFEGDLTDQAAAEPDTYVEVDVDPMDDIAVTIGRIVSIKGSVIWGALFDDVDGQAARAARMGALVSMRGPESRVFGIVNRLEREQQAGNTQSERTIFEVQVLGEIADTRTGFQRGVSSYPPLDAPVTTITIRDIATIYARPRSSNVHVGQLRHNPKVPAFVLTDSLLGKHFAVLGTTGTGKSCATTVILRSILDEHSKGHIVLIDPHNEYGPAFADRAELLNPSNLQLPYWLLNFEEIAHIILGGSARDQLDGQSAILKNAIIQAKAHFASGSQGGGQITVDTPVPYRLSDLVSALKDGMGMFNKAEGSALYLGLINRIESLSADQRYAFMFSSLALRDNMQQILAQLLRIPTNGKPMTIIDISGLPSEVVDVVVSVLFRLTFELAVWSERGKAPPVLLVCEEAHRYVPQESDGGFAPTKRVIAQIAKEGRKYGVTLCLVSQRPSELAVNSLAQCNTIFALRLSNEHDQAFVSQTLSENARWLVDSLPSLNTQEAVVVGDGVTVPVHIRFKNLAPEHRPASHDPSFAKSWRQEADDSFLVHAIDRWRRQAR
ncbi:MAG: ATP-binding protein [Geminicoccaceae bacterium]